MIESAELAVLKASRTAFVVVFLSTPFFVAFIVGIFLFLMLLITGYGYQFESTFKEGLGFYAVIQMFIFPVALVLGVFRKYKAAFLVSPLTILTIICFITVIGFDSNGYMRVFVPYSCFLLGDILRTYWLFRNFTKT